MAMEIRFKYLSYPETLDMYETDDDMKMYIDLYTRNKDITVNEACEKKIVQAVAYLYKNGGMR